MSVSSAITQKVFKRLFTDADGAGLERYDNFFTLDGI